MRITCNRGPFLTRVEQYSFSDIVLGQIYNQEDLGHEHLISFVHTKETVRELVYVRVKFHQIGEFIVKYPLLCRLPLKGIAVFQEGKSRARTLCPVWYGRTQKPGGGKDTREYLIPAEEGTR